MMKRLKWIWVAVALMVGGTAVGQINIPGGSIQKPPVPAAKQRPKPKKQARPKKQAKYYDVTFNCNAYDADLYIDGDYVGDANTIWTLKAGSHAVKVVTDYYNDYSTTINVSSNNKSFDLTLSEKSDAESQYMLAVNYYEGRSGFPQNYSEAVKHFLNAANKGHAKSQNWIGYCYEKGNGVTQSYAEAVKWYRKAAEQGYAAAQFNLGHCYHYGNGVTQSYTEAVNWYRQAAEQGFAKAQNNLGVCYEEGYGVTKSVTEAVKWYRKAAEQGNSKAKNNLRRLGY